MKLIIAVNREGYIGLNDELPWRSTNDLKHFKEKTLGCKLLVGRKTFESLPPLKDRELIVVGTGYNTLKEALEKKPDWVIGGKKLYNSVYELCDEFHISLINDETIGNVMFPEFDVNIMETKKVFYYKFDVNK